jgi:hypothetical protein
MVGAGAEAGVLPLPRAAGVLAAGLEVEVGVGWLDDDDAQPATAAARTRIVAAQAASRPAPELPAPEFPAPEFPAREFTAVPFIW